MRKKIALFSAVIVLTAIILFAFFSRRQLLSQLFPIPSYSAVNPAQFEVKTLETGLAAPTRIKITPDGKYLLVSQISGEVVAFHRKGRSWEQQPHPLTQVQTHFPGFPAEEGGLVGMAFSAEYAKNGSLFLLYSYRPDKDTVLNRIDVTTLHIQDDTLVASPPKTIFEANTPGHASHQITDGVGVLVADKPQLLFLIGEGFKAQRAQDPQQEAGKVMLIGEDGATPSGQRPYPQTPKIQAIGLRNGYVFAQNTFESPTSPHRFLLTDTGPDKYDRIIDLHLYDSAGKTIKPINLGWDGTEDHLLQPILDPNTVGVKDAVVMRLPSTLTFTGLAFHPGKGAIPNSTTLQQSVLLTVFGKTGSKENEPGKEIWLGKLENSSGQPTLTATPIIKRSPNAKGSLGNPIGLEVDPQTGNFFFADIFEGRIYQVIVK